MATEFAISRFLTPLLAHSGHALFLDSDVIVYGDVWELVDIAERQPHFIERQVRIISHGDQSVGP